MQFFVAFRLNNFCPSRDSWPQLSLKEKTIIETFISQPFLVAQCIIEEMVSLRTMRWTRED